MQKGQTTRNSKHYPPVPLKIIQLQYQSKPITKNNPYDPAHRKKGSEKRTQREWRNLFDVLWSYCCIQATANTQNESANDDCVGCGDLVESS